MITIGFIIVDTTEPTVAQAVKKRLKATQLQKRQGYCNVEGHRINWWLTNKKGGQNANG